MSTGRGESPEELEQVATLGLILASTGSTPVAASTSCPSPMPRISGEVLRHFCDRAATVRVSRRLRELQSVIYDAAAELSQRHSRAPRPSEIAHEIAQSLGIGA